MLICGLLILSMTVINLVLISLDFYPSCFLTHSSRDSRDEM